MVRYKLHGYYKNGNLKPIPLTNKYYKNLPFWQLIDLLYSNNIIRLTLYQENLYNNGSLEYINHYDFNNELIYILTDYLKINTGHHLKAIKSVLKDFDNRLLFKHLNELSAMKRCLIDNNEYILQGVYLETDKNKKIRRLTLITKDKNFKLFLNSNCDDALKLFKIKVW